MTRILLIGDGTGGRALVELLHKDPSIKVVAVVDKNERAPGLVLARQLGLPVGTVFRKTSPRDRQRPVHRRRKLHKEVQRHRT